MFNNNNIRFSNATQVARTMEYLKKNKTTKYVQYPTAFKVKVLDLMLEEAQKAAAGKDAYTVHGKFSKSAFYKACGIRQSVPSNGKWEDTYNTLDGSATVSANVCSVSRHSLGEVYTSAESQGLGSIAKETSALVRKAKELELKHGAAAMGFKLVKVA